MQYRLTLRMIKNNEPINDTYDFNEYSRIWNWNRPYFCAHNLWSR